MKHCRIRKVGHRGVTLIELVLALTIASIVLGVIYAAIVLAHRSMERGERRMDETQHFRTLIDRISPVIHSLYPYVRKTQEETLVFFDGQSDTLGFVTTDIDIYRDDIANLPGLKWVRFYTGSGGLFMRESYFFNEDVLEEESEGEELLIDPYVESIAFEYLEIKEDETQGTWLDEWDLEEEDRQQKLPRAVRISLRVEEGGKDVQVPPFVVRIYAYDPIL